MPILLRWKGSGECVEILGVPERQEVWPIVGQHYLLLVSQIQQGTWQSGRGLVLEYMSSRVLFLP